MEKNSFASKDQKDQKDQLQSVIDSFWETVPPVWIRIRNRIRSVATENFEISLEQFHVLRHLRKGMKTTSELAEAQQISRPAISQAMEMLVQKGLVVRSPDAGDRRFIQLDLTPAGNELLDAVFEVNRAWMAEKLSGLTAQEIQALLNGFKVLAKAFGPEI